MRTGSYRNRERTRALVGLAKLGIPDYTAELLLRDAAGLARRAELACSSEAADRDRVPCPVAFQEWGMHCLCQDYGGVRDDGAHGLVPRIYVQDAQAERRIKARLEPYAPQGIGVRFNGDPRGYVVVVWQAGGGEVGLA